MTHELLGWENVLKRSGHRVTHQRELIIEVICAGHGHTSFDDIVERTRARDTSVDRSTIYRTVHLFVDLGLVVEAKTGGTETLYEIRKPLPHHHLVCRSCGNEREVPNHTIQATIDAVFAEYGFRVSTDHLVLFGVCAACRAR